MYSDNPAQEYFKRLNEDAYVLCMFNISIIISLSELTPKCKGSLLHHLCSFLIFFKFISPIFIYLFFYFNFTCFGSAWYKNLEEKVLPGIKTHVKTKAQRCVVCRIYPQMHQQHNMALFPFA